MAMDKELKAKWVEALRSGKYEQGVGLLKTETNRYCCLGVLRDVADLKVESEIYLVDSQLTKVQLTNSEQMDLAKMNDGGEEHAKSFPEIAQYIEDNL